MKIFLILFSLITIMPSLSVAGTVDLNKNLAHFANLSLEDVGKELLLTNDEGKYCRVSLFWGSLLTVPKVTMVSLIKAVWKPGSAPYEREITTTFFETSSKNCRTINQDFGAECDANDCEMQGCFEPYQSFQFEEKSIVVNGYRCFKKL